jgi:type IV secretory pathway VirB3-like protein
MLYLLCLVSFCMSSKCTRAFRIYCSYRTHGSMALGFNIMFTVFVLVLYDNVLMHNDFSVIVITHFDQSMQGLMKDQFGNYVVQRILQTCDDKFLVVILSSIKMHLNELKNYTFGKHIVARVEKLIITGENRVRMGSKTSQCQQSLSCTDVDANPF